MRWAGNVACVGQKRSDYRILVGKREGKRPRRRYTRGWENNIKLSRLGPGAEAGSCGHSTEPSGYKKKCEEFLEWLSNY